MQQNQACSLEYRPVFSDIERPGRHSSPCDHHPYCEPTRCLQCATIYDIKSNELTKLPELSFYYVRLIRMRSSMIFVCLRSTSVPSNE